MKDPWTIDNPAFEPMYNEPVVIRHKDGNRTVEQTVSVAVFSAMTGDTISNDAIDTDREEISIAFKRHDWPFVQSLMRGDEIIRTATNGKRYKIAEAKYDEIMGWCLAARSK